MECKYVGSRGLLLSCDSKSSTPVPDFDGLNPELYHNIQEGELLHVCPQALPNFVKKVLPNIKNSFLLLTNNSDLTIGEDLKVETETLLTNPYLKHWFSQNCIMNHEKITRIPIGLDYHTLIPKDKTKFIWIKPQQHSWGEKVSPMMQEKELQTFKNSSKPFYERQLKAYANFHFLMSTRYAKKDRVDAYNTISKDLVYYEPSKCIRSICWDKMIQHAFVVSPHGNGLDCHRTWEALCLGCIPIIKTSGLDSLFQDLPVWIVSGWDEVTYINMVKIVDLFKQKTFNYEKLTLSYWQNLLKTKQDAS